MRTSFFVEANRRRHLLVALTAGALAAAALTILIVPGSTEVLTGVRPTRGLATPDDLPALAGEDATGFFQDRDQVEIRVPEKTTLRELLDRNRLNKPYQRAQIVEQLGAAAPETPIAAGTVFKLRLTPTAADVPGTTSKPKAGPR
jgi:hypothetical protein